MIRFVNPQYLNALWLLPVLAILAYIEYRWRIKVMLRWAQQKMWDYVLPDRSPRRILLKRWLGVMAIGLLIFAIAGPQVGTREIEVKREGRDIVIAIDVSQSMDTGDIVPSRLIKAKNELNRLLKQLRGDRVALVPFAGVAFVMVPLTLDYSSIITSLEAIEPTMIPYPGTSLEAAIQQARRAFRPDGKAQKILLMITDSEDHDTKPLEEAKLAAKEGIQIFSVGMATLQGGPIPIKNARGVITGYKEYQGSTVVSRLNEPMLKKLAEITGGEYYRATRTGSEFRKIHQVITGKKSEEFESKQFTDYEDRFQWPVLAAIILLLVEEAIPPGRRRKKKVMG